jgi:hypothetical protein
MDQDTGIRYGIVALNSLEEWVLDEFFHNGRNVSYEAARAEAFVDPEYQDEDGDFDEDLFSAAYECDEDCYELETDDGLQLGLSYLGGAALVWVYKSPYTCDCATCSPCIPFGGDLNTRRDPEGVGTYDLPADWYRQDC